MKRPALNLEFSVMAKGGRTSTLSRSKIMASDKFMSALRHVMLSRTSLHRLRIQTFKYQSLPWESVWMRHNVAGGEEIQHTIAWLPARMEPCICPTCNDGWRYECNYTYLS